MSSRSIVLITGGNAGLGFETVRALFRSSRAYTVLLGGRNHDKAADAAEQVTKEFPQSPSTVTPVQIDIEDDDSIAALSQRVESQYGRIDVLINNAGGSFDQDFYRGKLSMREAWNKAWSLNTTSTHVMTHAFVPLLLESSDPRLIFIASGTSTLTECENPAVPVNRAPSAKGWPKTEDAARGVPAYRASKTGMNMMMREWVRILRMDAVKIWAVSPGFLATGLGGDQEMNKKMGALDPTIGAELVRSVVEGDRDQDVGKVVRRDGVQPW